MPYFNNSHWYYGGSSFNIDKIYDLSKKDDILVGDEQPEFS